MSDEKATPASYERWIDKQIREAQERGEFDNLPGKGKPINGIDAPYDELWWVKQKLAREQVEFLDVEQELERWRGRRRGTSP